MRKFIIIALIAFAINNYITGNNSPNQTDANIFGHVLDKVSKEHLPYVTVKLQGTTIGITTDATGHYFLRNLPTGKFTLEVSMIGFFTVTQDVTIEAGKSLEVNFELIESATSLNEVVVSANRNETTRRTAPLL